MPTTLRNLLTLALVSFQFCLAATGAELQLAGLFTDGAVLQRNAPVPIWGRAKPGQSIQVKIASHPERIAKYPDALTNLINNLRADLNIPDLPFIAATIGEKRPVIENREQINAFLLDLPNRLPNTGCVGAREWKGHIGDNVHLDTATQEKIGRGYAEILLRLQK